MSYKKTFVLFLLLFVADLSLAAPIPATSSSFFLKTDIGMFRSEHGFSIHAGETSWVHTAAPEGNQYISTVYKAPFLSQGVQPSLTVRIDSLKKKKSLKSYMSRWLGDYSRLGFEVLASKKVKVGNNVGFLIDLFNKVSTKQLRQVVFVKDKTAVVLTCRDHKLTFNKTLQDCNQIIRNFAWL